MRCVPLPSARREPFRGPVWPANFAWPWDSALHNCCLAGLPLRLRRQDTRTEAFLRNLLTIPRNGVGSTKSTPPLEFFHALLDRMQLPGPTSKRKVGLTLGGQLVAGVVRDLLQARPERPVRSTPSVKRGALGRCNAGSASSWMIPRYHAPSGDWPPRSPQPPSSLYPSGCPAAIESHRRPSAT